MGDKQTGSHYLRDVHRQYIISTSYTIEHLGFWDRLTIDSEVVHLETDNWDHGRTLDWEVLDDQMICSPGCNGSLKGGGLK